MIFHSFLFVYQMVIPWKLCSLLQGPQWPFRRPTKSRQAILASDAKASLGHSTVGMYSGGLTSCSITHRNVVEIYYIYIYI